MPQRPSANRHPAITRPRGRPVCYCGRCKACRYRARQYARQHREDALAVPLDRCDHWLRLRVEDPPPLRTTAEMLERYAELFGHDDTDLPSR